MQLPLPHPSLVVSALAAPHLARPLIQDTPRNCAQAAHVLHHDDNKQNPRQHQTGCCLAGITILLTPGPSDANKAHSNAWSRHMQSIPAHSSAQLSSLWPPAVQARSCTCADSSTKSSPRGDALTRQTPMVHRPQVWCKTCTVLSPTPHHHT